MSGSLAPARTTTPTPTRPTTNRESGSILLRLSWLSMTPGGAISTSATSPPERRFSICGAVL